MSVIRKNLDFTVFSKVSLSNFIFLNTIISNYSENSTVVISTHLISDVEKVLDEVLFINKGEIVLQDMVDHIRDEQGKSVDTLFREVFKC